MTHGGFSRKALIRGLLGISILVLLTVGAANELFSPNSAALAAPANAPFDHIVIIMLENHGLNQIYGSGSAPYLTGLANAWSLSEHYTAVDHPSEPNYLAMGSGLAGDCRNPAPNTGGCLSGGGNSTSDKNPTAPNGSYSSSAANMVARLEASGFTWEAYLEGSSVGGANSFGAAYHAWFLFMNDIVRSPNRCSHIHPFTTTSPTNLVAELNSGSSANLIWINPDNNHNMHYNSVSSGDTYMSTLIPQILSSTEFTTTKALLLVTFDEGSSSYPSDYVYTVFAGPAAKTAYKSITNYTHYSILKTLETAWGIQSLQSTDANAAAMTELLTAVSTYPQPPFNFDWADWTIDNKIT